MAQVAVVTPIFRAGFLALFRPFVNKNDDGSEKRSYSVRAFFNPNDAGVATLKAAAGAAAKEKWGDKIPKNMRSPFRTNAELDSPNPAIPDDWVVMTFSAQEDKFSSRHNLVDAKNQPIMDEAEVYAGAWFRAQVQPFAYEKAANRGVSFGLRNIQKIRDDEALGGGRVSANKAFEPVAEAGGSADSIFS